MSYEDNWDDGWDDGFDNDERDAWDSVRLDRSLMNEDELEVLDESPEDFDFDLDFPLDEEEPIFDFDYEPEDE